MAWGLLSAPGSRYGPCLDPCAHIDCAATRQQAASRCRLCGQQIGYGVRIYNDPESTTGPKALVHADCLEGQIEWERGR